MNKRKVLSVKGKVKVICQTEMVKMKADVCQEFGLVNSMVQTVWKYRTKVISAFEWNGFIIKRFQKLE
jgi:hypothetical protein